MLINCPKCGFSQPKDKYCASCGVDIDSFIPQAPSLGKSLLGNPFFHLSIVGVLAFGSWIMIRQNQQRELRNRIEYLQSGPVVIERSAAPDGTVDSGADMTMAEVSAENQDASTLAQSTSTTLVGSETRVAPLSGTAKSVTAAAAAGFVEPNDLNIPVSGEKAEGRKLSITFAEIDLASLNNLMRESQRTGQFNRFGEAFWGVVPEMDKRLTTIRNLRSLGREERGLDAENSTQFFVGGHSSSDPEVDAGLLFYIQAVEGENGVTKVEVEVQRSFRELGAGANLLKKSFPAAFEVRKGQGFMMGGILPREIESGGDLESPQGFFQIFRSAQYASKQSEFTLLFTFDNP